MIGNGKPRESVENARLSDYLQITKIIVEMEQEAAIHNFVLTLLTLVDISPGQMQLLTFVLSPYDISGDT